MVMRYKKHMIILLAAIFLFAMATASAADSNDTAVAVEDGQLTDEIIQASENQENTIQASYNDEVNLSEDDSGKLAIGNDKKLGKTVTEHTFDAIDSAIESDCTIYLEPGTYTGDNYIEIYLKSNVKIIGNSTILDAQGKRQIFHIEESSNITIQNIIFINGKNRLSFSGGAIDVYDSRDCGISNCTFINNHANDGGAISWSAWCVNGRVSNCTFINNTAEKNGGAIYWYNSNDGHVNNCTFINSTAELEGDAIYAGGCDLNADYNWFGNTVDNYNGPLPINRYVKCDCRLFLKATANPDTITGKDTSNVTFKLYQYHSGVISDYDNAPFKNLDLTITATKGNVKGTAKLGEPIQFTPTRGGTASVTATVEDVRQTVEINVKGDFDLLQDLVNNESLSIINLERNYTYNEFDTITDGVRITRPITINGNGFTIDAKGKSRIFNVTAGTINITDVTLKNGKAINGGAIYFSNAISNSDINATYINNTANGQGDFDGGGANYFNKDVSDSNITGIYTYNTATNGGGANYFWYSVSGSNVSGTYINNTASEGVIIYFMVYSNAILTNVTIENAIFLNNNYNESMGIIFAGKTGVVAKNNWFGNNATNYNTQPKTTGIQMDSWLFLNATADPSSLLIMDSSNVTFKLCQYYSELISDYDNAPFKNLDLTITATNGNVKGTAKLGEPIQFTPTGKGTASVTATVETVHQTAEINVLKGDFDLLQDLVNNESLSIINLERNYTYNEFDTITEGVRINRPITINGNSFTIDAKGKSRIFYIEANNVVIENLTLKNGKAYGSGGAIYFDNSGTVTNCNFTNNKATGDNARGGAIYFLDQGTVTNCNFTDNTATYSGGAIRFQGECNVTNCNFVDNKATGDSSYGGAIYIYSGTVTNCNFTDNTASDWGGAIRMYSGTVSNCNFTNNTASGDGGAVLLFDNGEVTNCNFTGNTATGDGGAINMGSGTVSNCNFADNTAGDWGGAVFFMNTGNVSNCNFTGNNATIGSAIYFYSTSATKTVSNSRFLNNRANAEALEITKNDNNITITFTGRNNLLNAIYSSNDAEVTFTNVTYWGANGIATVSATMSGSNKATGQNITVGVVVNGKVVLNEVKVTDDNGMIVLPIIAGENYYISARHDTDSYYTEAETTISNNTKFNVNVTSQTTTNKTVNITAKSNIYSEFMPGKLLFILPNGDEINATYAADGIWWALHTFDGVGDYNINASYTGLDNVTINTATISIRYDARVVVQNKTLDLFVGDDALIVVTTVPIGVSISFVPDDSGVYSLENGRVIALREGTGNILIKIVGFGVYIENSTEIAVTVSKVPTEIDIENDTLKLEISDEVATGATLTPADAGNVTYAISNSSVVEVKDGKIIALAEGEAAITVSFAGDKKYADAENKTIAVNVTLKDVSISLNNSTLDLFIGDNFTIVATTNPAGLDVSFVPDDSGVYSVDENGTITALREGTGNILVKFGGKGIYAENSTEIPVTVSKVPTEIKIASPTGEMSAGAMAHVAAELNPSKAGNLTYTSNDTSVVNVSETGVIKANMAGTALITVSFAGNDNYAAAENKTIAITVSLNDASISINNSTLDLCVGDNFTIVAATNPAGLNVTFVPDDSGVYSVDENGTVTALREGTGNILVKVGDGKVYAENSTEVTVTVSKIATEITLTNETIELKPHKSIGDLASLSPAEAGNLTYTSSDEDIVLVSEEGVIYARIKGTATVTVSFAGDNKYKAAENRTITVNVTLNYASVSTENDTIDLYVDDACIINATANPSFLTVYYASSNESVATVTDYGNVKAVGEGTAVITLTVGNGETYAVNSTNVTVTVSKVPTEISIENYTLKLEVTDEVDTGATLTPADAGNVTYTISNSSIVKVKDGKVIALAEGEAAITVSFVGDVKYAVAENKTITVNVSLKDASVSVNNDTLDLFVDDTFNLVATTEPKDLTVNFTSSNPSIVTVDNKGNVVAVGEGIANITVSVGCDGVYAENSTIVTVTVSKIPTEIIVQNVTVDMNVGDIFDPVVSLMPSNAGRLSFRSSNDTVVLINGHGMIKAVGEGNATVTVAFDGNEKYAAVSRNITVSVSKQDANINVSMPENVTVGENSTVNVVLPDDATGNVTVNVDGEVTDTVAVTDGTAEVTISSLSVGNHTVEIAYSGDDKYNSASKTATITVNKDSTNIASADVSATYKVNKYLVINLTDSKGNPLANSTVTVELSTAKNYTSDENGQIKVKVSSLVPKTYTAKITFKGDDKYSGSNTTAEVTVKKATAKITAKAKTFKTTTKTKKYTVTLKANGKALKNKWVYLKVNGKKYKAKTNSKGKATFKITQLNKAGKFKATVTFKGNDYYKKATKKTTIKVKSVWKTVQKGSKNSAIVKKIQRALKNHGYYLEYNGHYLKVDGIFWDYTEMAVKEFQNDKTLKVTGKVDEKTARKLGII